MDSRTRNGNREIANWETLNTIFSDSRSTNRANIGVTLQINRPVFTDGQSGYPKLSLVIARDSMKIRFPFFDGDAGEIRALVELLDRALEEHENGGYEEFRQLVEARKAEVRARYQQQETEYSEAPWPQEDPQRGTRNKGRRRRNRSRYDEDDDSNYR